MKCTFAGHSKLNGELSSQTLLSALEVLIQSDCTFIFYTGGMGDFDRMGAAAVRQLKTAYPEKRIDLILVLPYQTKQLQYNRDYLYTQYDDIIIPVELLCIHPKAAILKRNYWMIDHSDILLSYISHNWGGAYKSKQYAQKKNISIIELSKQSI